LTIINIQIDYNVDKIVRFDYFCGVSDSKAYELSREHKNLQGTKGTVAEGSRQRRGRPPVQLFQDGKRGTRCLDRSGRQARQVFWRVP
tara:strand:+ start:67087 stop:67350 length:264 start_codon:yes stop_codon:yes gene_type:complete